MMATQTLTGRGKRSRRHPTPPEAGTVAGLMAVAAGAGAVGLAGGGIDFGPEISDRLPGGYPLAGLALGVVVALPMAVTAIAGWRRSRRTGDLAVLAGGALMGWIVVQVAVIQSFSWLQPACFGYGAVVLALGLLLRKAQRLS